MKKLMMTAAAMTIAGGVYAQCVINTPGPGEDCAMVYNVKFSGKTTIAKYLPYSEGGSICDLGSGEGDYIYREPKSFKWQGYLASCFCGCDEFNFGMYLMLWDKKQKAYVFNDGIPLQDLTPGWWMEVVGGSLVPAANPVVGSIMQWGVLGHAAQQITGVDDDIYYGGGASGEYTSSPYNVISKKDNKVEAFWSITRAATLPVIKKGVVTSYDRPISLYGAGQGSMDSKLLLAKSISGNFAGMIGAPYYESDVICDPAGALDCSLVNWDLYDSAIYGKWTIKYNSAFSQKLVHENYGHDYVYKKSPDYANKYLRSNNYRYVTPTLVDICNTTDRKSVV